MIILNCDKDIHQKFILECLFQFESSVILVKYEVTPDIQCEFIFTVILFIYIGNPKRIADNSVSIHFPIEKIIYDCLKSCYI